MPRRVAVTTMTGSSAATAALTVTMAVRAAQTSIIRMTSFVRLVPARSISCWPAHAVTPVESSASLTTNRAAMKMTVWSPNPARLCSRVRTPVAHSTRVAPMATTSTGRRPHTNRTTIAAMTAKVIPMSLIRSAPVE